MLEAYIGGLKSRPAGAKMREHTGKAGAMAPVVEHLPSKCQSLSSTPVTTKIINNNFLNIFIFLKKR
jgi:hypothetical protein